MINERDWYGRDWKNLRKNLIKLCLLYSDDLLMNFGSSDIRLENNTKIFFEQIVKDVNGKISQDRFGMWEMALPLIVNQQRFTKWLHKDEKALCGQKKYKGNSISPRQALGQKLLQHFELARREQLAIGRGVSVNRIKTWERLDRISREIAKKTEAGQRCSEAHFTELAAFIKKKHSHDKNLPRRINTIGDYFYQFSNDCLNNMEYIDNIATKIDTLSINDAQGLLHGVGKVELQKCLMTLSAEDFEIIDVSFKLGLGSVQYLSLNNFLKDKSLSVKQYEEKRNNIMAKLRDCLEFNLEKQFEENMP